MQTIAKAAKTVIAKSCDVNTCERGGRRKEIIGDRV
jgi:hypothetical protein